jgi:uncharacterized protein (DUF1778 family)
MDEQIDQDQHLDQVEKVITIRLSMADRERLKLAAKAEGKSMNQYCVDVFSRSFENKNTEWNPR